MEVRLANEADWPQLDAIVRSRGEPAYANWCPVPGFALMVAEDDRGIAALLLLRDDPVFGGDVYCDTFEGEYVDGALTRRGARGLYALQEWLERMLKSTQRQAISLVSVDNLPHLSHLKRRGWTNPALYMRSNY